eukprot:TRINITY_DN19251_c0_g1_i1.p1 TRINITY_DN19251_c0_g1~~TRINITY_DN19251_c0_g1_i1.p1  ORF type:complete len:391 (+),score=54.83 TRINITY_DN19251_c0_g1_i1:55-1173(+)
MSDTMTSTATPTLTGAKSQVPRLTCPFTRDEIEPFPELRNGKYLKGLKKPGVYGAGRGGTGGGFTETGVSYQNGTLTERTAVKGLGRSSLGGTAGYLETTTEAKARQNEAFSQDVLDTFAEGRAKELELGRQRAEVLKHFETEKPPPWTSTAQSTYVNLLPATERTFGETSYCKPKGRRRVDLNAVHKDRTNYTESYLARHEAMNDKDALEAMHREEMSKSMRAAKSANGGWVGGAPSTTYRHHMQTFDVQSCEDQMSAFAKNPVPHRSLAGLDPDAFPDKDPSVRYSGMYATTQNASFQDRSREGEPTQFRKSHYFEKAGDVLHLPKRGDDPLRKPTNFHDTRNMAEVVPAHYVSMKTFQEQVTAGGLAVD